MSLRDEFHCFLDREWPLWREPKNNGGMKYHQLYRAFAAGYKLGEDGVTPESLADAIGDPISLLEAVKAKPRKFVPPQRRRS